MRSNGPLQTSSLVLFRPQSTVKIRVTTSDDILLIDNFYCVQKCICLLNQQCEIETRLLVLLSATLVCYLTSSPPTAIRESTLAFAVLDYAIQGTFC